MTAEKTVPYGSDVSAGTYECADCGYRLSNQSKSSLPPCPNPENKPHTENAWRIVSGQGDAPQDPYPNE
ncbi:zinc ribbon-containing protein [Alteromonas sp. ASW11-19]|uniref:Zinc ribbon-containing protein n=1 Tax=Alteromonas salexigens TaxID=2982530 RepID=A0ABT2VQG4_9ALTE|nr:zinc ribbon-containing protein [Alteromonas salexigens]MCU7555558.1 zinc ribbon-containing protein [Alteromonas salexigens]